MRSLDPTGSQLVDLTQAQTDRVFPSSDGARALPDLMG